MTEGYIKLSRKLLDWEWYTDANTMRVWIHLILIANWKEGRFKGEVIPRGSVACSYASIAKNLKLSYKQIRTSIGHLVGAQQVTLKKCRNFLILSVVHYDEYQSEGRPLGTDWQDNGHTKGNNRRIERIKNKKKNAFGDFPQREYDFAEMERSLFNGIPQIPGKESSC